MARIQDQQKFLSINNFYLPPLRVQTAKKFCAITNKDQQRQESVQECGRLYLMLEHSVFGISPWMKKHDMKNYTVGVCMQLRGRGTDMWTLPSHQRKGSHSVEHRHFC